MPGGCRSGRAGLARRRRLYGSGGVAAHDRRSKSGEGQYFRRASERGSHISSPRPYGLHPVDGTALLPTGFTGSSRMRGRRGRTAALRPGDQVAVAAHVHRHGDAPASTSLKGFRSIALTGQPVSRSIARSAPDRAHDRRTCHDPPRVAMRPRGADRPRAHEHGTRRHLVALADHHRLPVRGADPEVADRDPAPLPVAGHDIPYAMSAECTSATMRGRAGIQCSWCCHRASCSYRPEAIGTTWQRSITLVVRRPQMARVSCGVPAIVLVQRCVLQRWSDVVVGSGSRNEVGFPYPKTRAHHTRRPRLVRSRS
jgi:hypothetical protein